MKVSIVRWRQVAVWRWRVNEAVCGICRAAFDATCPECKMPGDDCPPVWGQCSHHFHMHCVFKWLQTAGAKEQCPMCRQEWRVKDAGDGDRSDTDRDELLLQ